MIVFDGTMIEPLDELLQNDAMNDYDEYEVIDADTKKRLVSCFNGARINLGMSATWVRLHANWLEWATTNKRSLWWKATPLDCVRHRLVQRRNSTYPKPVEKRRVSIEGMEVHETSDPVRFHR